MNTVNQDILSDIAVLKRDVNQLSGVFIRLESAIEKVGELANGVTKMLAVHEEKISADSDSVEHLYTWWSNGGWNYIETYRKSIAN
jgi:uncharacterized protein HemX